MRGIRYRVAMSLDGYIARPKGEFDWIVAHPERDVADKERDTVAALRAQPGKDLWLFGGGLLFRSFLDAGLLDTLEVAVIPVLLGGEIPLLPARAESTKLKSTGRKVYGSGIALFEYSKQEYSQEHSRK